MPLTTACANAVLDWMLGKDSLSDHSKVYIGLCSNDPEADGGTIVELSGGGYHRVLISQIKEAYPDVIGKASDRMIQNTKQINWTKATANWLTAKGIILSTSSTVGETAAIFFYGKLEEPFPTTEAGAVALFDPNTLKISFPAVDTSVNATTA